MADFYDILGVQKGASEADIRRAYRKLAQQYHPDKSGGDEKKFREVNEAYEVLSSADKRQQYDQFGTTFNQQGGPGGGGDPFSDFARGFGGFSWSGGGGGGGAENFDFGDIFSDIFGGSRAESRRTRGVDLEIDLDISFLEAVFGTEKDIPLQKKDSCPTCSGSGAKPGTKLKTCPKCHGQGQLRKTQRTILGNISSSFTCDVCNGKGKVAESPCDNCHGEGIKQQLKTIKVMIPPGIDDGQRIRLSSQGEVGYKGSSAGDLYVRVNVASHESLRREGVDIHSEIPISYYQAVLGTRVEVPTVDGPVELKIPDGVQSGKTFRLRGKGVPHLNSKKRGDHLVTVFVVTPTKLTRKEKELFKKLAEENGEVVDIEDSVWDRIKGQFE